MYLNITKQNMNKIKILMYNNKRKKIIIQISQKCLGVLSVKRIKSLSFFFKDQKTARSKLGKTNLFQRYEQLCSKNIMRDN